MYRRDRHFGSKTLLALALCAAGGGVAYAAGKPALGVVIEGVPYTQLQNNGLTHGVAVRGLVSGSPAEQSGIRPGDIIVNINQQPVYSPDQLQWLVGHLEPNQKARITYVHQGQQKTTTIEPVAAVAGGQTPSQQQAGAAPSGQATGQGPSGQQGAQQGQSGQSYLGIAMQPMTEDLANALGSPTGNGVLIAKVQKGGPATSCWASATRRSRIRRMSIRPWKITSRASRCSCASCATRTPSRYPCSWARTPKARGRTAWAVCPGAASGRTASGSRGRRAVRTAALAPTSTSSSGTGRSVCRTGIR
jgi:hypothetical protein